MVNYYKTKMQEVNSKLTDDTVNYIFISDIHYMGIGTGQGAVLLEQMEKVVEFANQSEKIDLVVLGGDTVQGYWANKHDCFEALGQILAPLKKCKKPVLILNGNHDDNAYAEWIENYSQKIISDLDWHNIVLSPFATPDRVHDKTDPNCKYYYYDFKKGSKTYRIFCLDATDYKTEYDENGVVQKLKIMPGYNEDSPEERYKYQMGISWWGYSAEELRWFSENLNSGDFDEVIIFSHMGVDRQPNYRDIPLGDELRDILRAYKRKTSYRNEELEIDVTYNDKGKVLIYHYGHIHREAMLYFDDIDFWQIASSTARADQADPFAPREEGSENEPCFDIVAVGLNGFEKYNIGGGTDFKWLR